MPKRRVYGRQWDGNVHYEQYGFSIPADRNGTVIRYHPRNRMPDAIRSDKTRGYDEGQVRRTGCAGGELRRHGRCVRARLQLHARQLKLEGRNDVVGKLEIVLAAPTSISMSSGRRFATLVSSAPLLRFSYPTRTKPPPYPVYWEASVHVWANSTSTAPSFERPQSRRTCSACGRTRLKFAMARRPVECRSPQWHTVVARANAPGIPWLPSRRNRMGDASTKGGKDRLRSLEPYAVGTDCRTPHDHRLRRSLQVSDSYGCRD
jgi:hypothetical protein